MQITAHDMACRARLSDYKHPIIKAAEPSWSLTKVPRKGVRLFPYKGAEYTADQLLDMACSTLHRSTFVSHYDKGTPIEVILPELA